MSDTELEIVSVLEDARITAMCEQDDETLDRLLSEELVSKTNAVYQFNVKGQRFTKI